MYDTLPIEELVAAIDVDYNDGIPDDALLAARQRRDEVIPHLIALIRRETALVRSGEAPSPSSGIFAALFLLTEFSAKDALPAIMESLSLPNEGPFDLYGDIVTNSMSSVLAELASESSDVIDRLIADPSLNEYVRWEAAQTCLHYVRDGRLTREAAVERLRSHLATALANDDHEIITPLVMDLSNYVPREAMTEIRQAFDRGLVEDFSIDLKSIEDDLADGDTVWQESLDRCKPTGCADAIAELHEWFDETPPDSWATSDLADDEEWDDLEHDLALTHDPDDEYLSGGAEEPMTIHRTQAKVGRNDPCPCGSGKKYKKCCGRA